MPNYQNNLELGNSSHFDARQDMSLMSVPSAIESIVRSASYLTEKINYSDHVFINAAKVFQRIHVKKPPDRILVTYGSDLEVSATDCIKDEKSQRWSYELAFSALKYQDLLETILLDSGFYYTQPIPEEMNSLVVVMLYDFQDRKFQPRYIYNEEEEIREVREVENLLYSYKTKLAASLARSRIKHDAPAIEYILPENVRKQEQRASTLPLYAWINTTKTSLTEVFNTLKSERFSKVNSPSEFDGYNYCMDKHCQDVLIFPPYLKEELNNLDIFIDYKLVLQDNSHNLAVHSVKALMNMNDDIIVANPCPGLTLAHMSILTDQFACNIFVCGIKSETRKEELQELFANMECKNIKLLKDVFTDIDPTDQKLQKAKIILLQPQCSGSGVSDPVDFVLNEQGDTTLLQDFSQGSVPSDKLHDLANQQLFELNHALKFSKVQGIVYCTSSIYQVENEDVINQGLGLNMENVKGQPYRLGPPVIPLCSSSEILSASKNFFKIEPSETMNGCFLAVLTRERDPSDSVSVKDVLARAAAKGLLEGIEIPSRREEKKKKRKTSPPKATPSISVTQTKIAEFLNRENSQTNPKTSPKQNLMISQKSQNNLNKKPSKHVPISSVPTVIKNTSISSVPKGLDRQTTITMKQRSEEKMVLLKPVKIILPPMMMPFYNTQSIVKARNSTPYYQRWNSSVRNNSQNSFIPSLSIADKTKDTLNVLRHPKPWV
ncbi:putative methyltransferase NSUN7 [Pelodytes ibericus]